MMWMTVYLEWGSENSKVIEAQWCANTLDGEIQNYLFSALTSKSLRVKSGDSYFEVSPNSYYMYMTGGKDHFTADSDIVCIKSSYDSGDVYCDTVALAYHETGYGLGRHSIDQYNYKLLNSDNCTQVNNVKLLFYRSWSFSNIWMNKWFSQLWQNNKRSFYIKTISAGAEELSQWEIIILGCMAWNKECLKTQRKEIAKRVIDTRSQTITLKKCKFYKETDPNLCETREE